MFELDEATPQSLGAKIKVVGIGGGGGNAVNTMIRAGLSGVEFINANTDNQALQSSLAGTKIQLGHTITKGLGAGANPDVGRRSALEDYNKIAELLDGSDMVFITAGMGGGTGTGAAPIIAKIAKEVGALTVGVVTKPFDFEGKKRKRQAEEGIRFLKESVDSLITIPNQRLLSIAGNSLTIVDTFRRADEVLLNAVQGISDLINHTGLINSDFADVRTIMADRGLALMGTGIGQGEHRAIEAATNAISSPLLEDVCIDGATGLIINITGGSDLTTFEVNEATTLIMEAADEDAEIIFGTVIDESMKDKVKITVIATGIGTKDKKMVGTQAESLEAAIEAAKVNPAPLVNTTAASAITVVEAPKVELPKEPTKVENIQVVSPPPVVVAALSPVPIAANPVSTLAPVMQEMPEPEPQPQHQETTVAAPAEPQNVVELETSMERKLVPPPIQPTQLSRTDAPAPVDFYASAAVKESVDEQVALFESEAAADTETNEAKQRAAAEAAARESVLAREKAKLAELERAKQIARNLGVTNLSDDEYDIPTFIRRQQSAPRQQQ